MRMYVLAATLAAEAAEAFRQARIKGRHFNIRIRGRYLFSEAPPD